MDKLVLVRYGESTNGHLNEQGMQTMVLTAKRLRYLAENQSACIICAKIPRAIESAKIISKNLNISGIQSFEELYAAEDVPIFLDTAIKIINSVGEKYDVIIAVISREYIEALPNHILQGLGSQKTTETHLNRGEALVIDYKTKKINYLKSGV